MIDARPGSGRTEPLALLNGIGSFVEMMLAVICYKLMNTG